MTRIWKAPNMPLHLKRSFKFLLWSFPRPYVAVCCGVGGGLMFVGGTFLAVKGNGGPALLFLLLGSASMCSLLPRKTP
jgi:hypothetical protein